MARNDVGATLFVVLGDSQIQDVVQSVQLPLNAAAASDIDKRIAGSDKYVAGADDIGMAEEHDAVAIGVSNFLVQDVHRLVIEPQSLAIAKEGIGRPGVCGCRRLISGSHAHAIEQRLVGNNRGAFGSIRDVAGNIRSRDGDAGRAQLRVPTGVIRMNMRIDDVLQGLVWSQFADGCDHFIGGLRESGVDDQDAHLAHLHRDVPSRAHQHVDVALDRKSMNLAIGGIRILCLILNRHGHDLVPLERVGGNGGRILEHLLELWIHRFRTAQRCNQRQVIHVGVFGDERILARQIIWHRASRPAFHFFHFFARVQPVSACIGVLQEILGFHQRLSEIYGIGNDADVRQVFAMADEVFYQCGLIALRQTVAAHPALLDVRGVDR